MPFIFDSGRQALDAAFQFAAITIATWERGAATLATNVLAKPAKTVFSADAVYMSPLSMRFAQIDFLIRKADCPDFEPQLGDVLTDDRGGRYELTAPSGEPVWRDHTPEVYRIHALRIGNDA